MLATDSILHNRYHIESLLGEGGMGAVYRAHDETLGVTVAVKENQVVTSSAQRQFEREARLLAGLRHPNLPRVTDHFIIPGQGQYLVMDFVEGEDLSKRLARLGRLPEERVLLWAQDILDALAYLHLRDIIHRDIKPANIKIGNEGRAMLVDFGIAKVAGTGQTTTGARGLTPGYAPPEQYGFGSTDPRSDVYSFGATLYHALTGEISTDAFARLMQHTPLTPIRHWVPEVSPRTAHAVEKALALRPEDRWQNAVEMQRAIEPETKPSRSNAASLPTLALPDAQATTIAEVPPPPQPPQPIISVPAPAPEIRPAPVSTAEGRPITAPRPTSRIVIGVGLVGLASLVGLVLVAGLIALAFSSGLFGRRAPITLGPEQIAFSSDRNGNFEIYLANTDGSGLVNLTNDVANDMEPAFSPNGQQIAFVSDRDGNPDVFVMNADGSNVLNMTNNSAVDIMPTWSPDGRTLAFASDREGDFEIFTLGPGGLTRYTDDPHDDLWPSYSRSGEHLAFASNRDGNFEIYVIGPEGLQRYTNSDAEDKTPRWSPVADVLAFDSDRDGDRQIFLFESDGVRRYTNTEGASNSLAAWSPDGKSLAFVSDRDGNDDIYILGPDGTVPVIQSPAQDTEPSWRYLERRFLSMKPRFLPPSLRCGGLRKPGFLSGKRISGFYVLNVSVWPSTVTA